MSHGSRQHGACHWTATKKSSIDTVTLTVKGVCEEPTPGYKLTLTPVNAPGTDSDTLTLALTVVAPTGIEPDHVTPTPVEYDKTYVRPIRHEPVPTRVEILEPAATVPVT
jgi:hypothetical protein